MTAKTRNHDGGDGRIDQELACLHGREELRQDLRDLGRSEEHIDELLRACDGWADFARVVVATRRHEQSDGE